MRIEWQEYLSTGILEIDIQHKLLFEKYNAFLEGCEEERGSEEVMKLFWFLEAYAVTHFNDEERVMQSLGHPDTLQHKEQHKAFIQKVAEVRDRLKTEGPTPHLVLTVTRFVSSWLVNHISTMDRAIAASSASSQRP